MKDCLLFESHDNSMQRNMDNIKIPVSSKGWTEKCITPFERLTTGPYTPQLDRFFPCSRPPSKPCSFFKLPIDVRQRIYEFTDLVRSCPIDLATPNVAFVCDDEEEERALLSARDGYIPYHRPTGDQYQEVYDQQCKCFMWSGFVSKLDFWGAGYYQCAPISSALLYVCRQVYHEALPVLYGKNKFCLRTASITLRRLETLPPNALSSIKSLILRVDLKGRHPIGRAERGTLYETFRSGPNAASNVAQQTFELFRRIVKRLTSHTNEFLLELSIYVSNLNDPGLLVGITDAIAAMPVVRKASMKVFGNTSTDSITQEHIERTLRLLTTNNARDTSFHLFNSLPSEIQAKIIRFAAVVSTDRSFGSLPSTPPYPQTDPNSLHLVYTPDAERYRKRFTSNFVRPRCCGTCHPFISTDCWEKCRISDYVEICMCPRFREWFTRPTDPESLEAFLNSEDHFDTHASWSTTCTCLLVPTRLFLVSQQFGHLAEKAFYENTRFILATGAMADTIDYGHSCLIASNLHQYSLSDHYIPHRHWASMRYIQIRMRIVTQSHPPLTRQEPGPHLPEWRSGSPTRLTEHFVTVFRSLMTKLDFQRLTLAIHLANRWTENSYEPDFYPHEVSQWVSVPTVRDNFAACTRSIASIMRQALEVIHPPSNGAEGSDYESTKMLKDVQIYTTSPAGEEFNNARLELEAECERVILGSEGTTSDFGRKVSFAPLMQWLPGYEEHRTHLVCAPGMCVTSDPKVPGSFEVEHWWWNLADQFTVGRL